MALCGCSCIWGVAYPLPGGRDLRRLIKTFKAYGLVESQGQLEEAANPPREFGNIIVRLTPGESYDLLENFQNPCTLISTTSFREGLIEKAYDLGTCRRCSLWQQYCRLPRLNRPGSPMASCFHISSIRRRDYRVHPNTQALE